MTSTNLSELTELERRAVVRGARYGRWNGQRAGLFFETWQPNGGATLHVLYDGSARRVMAEAGMNETQVAALVDQAGVGGADVTALEGRACIVTVDGYRTLFRRLSNAA